MKIEKIKQSIKKNLNTKDDEETIEEADELR